MIQARVSLHIAWEFKLRCSKPRFVSRASQAILQRVEELRQQKQRELWSIDMTDEEILLLDEATLAANPKLRIAKVKIELANTMKKLKQVSGPPFPARTTLLGARGVDWLNAAIG